MRKKKNKKYSGHKNKSIEIDDYKIVSKFGIDKEEINKYFENKIHYNQFDHRASLDNKVADLKKFEYVSMK